MKFLDVWRTVQFWSPGQVFLQDSVDSLEIGMDVLLISPIPRKAFENVHSRRKEDLTDSWAHLMETSIGGRDAESTTYVRNCCKIYQIAL